MAMLTPLERAIPRGSAPGPRVSGQSDALPGTVLKASVMGLFWRSIREPAEVEHLLAEHRRIRASAGLRNLERRAKSNVAARDREFDTVQSQRRSLGARAGQKQAAGQSNLSLYEARARARLHGVT
jgi:hypothetical protein